MEKNANLHKCEAKDCDRMLEEPYKYCSIECACYCGAMDVRWKIEAAKGEPIRIVKNN